MVGRGVDVGLGVLVGLGVEVGRGVEVGCTVGVGEAAPPGVGEAPVEVGAGVPPPSLLPIDIFKGDRGQVTISLESEARLILLSASEPLVQSKANEVLPLAKAFKERVA